MEASTQILAELTGQGYAREFAVTFQEFASSEKNRTFAEQLRREINELVLFHSKSFPEERKTAIVEHEVAGGFKPSPLKRLEVVEALAGRPITLPGVVDERVPANETEKSVDVLILPIICEIDPNTQIDTAKITTLVKTVHTMASYVPDRELAVSSQRDDTLTVKIGRIEKTLYLAQLTISGQYNLCTIPLNSQRDPSAVLQAINGHLLETGKYDFTKPPNNSEFGVQLLAKELGQHLTKRPYGSFIKIPIFTCPPNFSDLNVSRMLLVNGGAWAGGEVVVVKPMNIQSGVVVL